LREKVKKKDEKAIEKIGNTRLKRFCMHIHVSEVIRRVGTEGIY
jgi:hypothetical protein